MVISAGRVDRSDAHIAASIPSFRSGQLEPGRTVNGSAYLALRHPACQRKGVGGGGSLANGIVIASTELDTPGIAAAPNCNPDIDGDGAFLATTDALIFLRIAVGINNSAAIGGINFPTAAARKTWPLIRDYLVMQCGFSLP